MEDERILEPHVKDEQRQQGKRQGKYGHPGKAGRIEHKGGAGTSNKATGGKGAK